MQYISMIFCLVAAVAAMVLVKSLDLSGWLTAALVVAVILVVIYALAWIQARDRRTPATAAEEK